MPFPVAEAVALGDGAVLALGVGRGPPAVAVADGQSGFLLGSTAATGSSAGSRIVHNHTPAEIAGTKKMSATQAAARRLNLLRRSASTRARICSAEMRGRVRPALRSLSTPFSRRPFSF